MGSRTMLLQNGTALMHDQNNHVIPTQTSILIEEGLITKIGPNIEAPSTIEVIDCTNKIISPGFVDTHHHGWQTQLKGRHANEQLLEYMVTGNAQSVQYSPEDVFYGQLSGMLETLAAGTTTVLDHAHITCTPEHPKLAIAAMVTSGIRAVYGYTPIMRVKNFNPLTFHPNPFEDWVMQTFHSLADSGPFGHGRVSLGFAFDLFFLPSDMVKGIFAQVKQKGVKTITCHGSSLWGTPIPQTLRNLDLLDESIVISHGGPLTRSDAELIKSGGAHLSSTPSSELQMAMGRPYCFDDAFLDGGASGQSIGLQDIASLGIDCHAHTAGSIVSEAKLGLLSGRSYFNDYHLKNGKTPKTLPQSLSIEAAFNLATIKGAEALRMQDQIGRIKEGYKADLVVFDALSPSMVGAAQHDAVVAVIMHSSPADVEMVIVDGIVRKRDGKLLPVVVDEVAKETIKQENLQWRDIAEYVVESRARMQKEMDKIDYKEALASLIKLYHVDEDTLVDV